MSHLRRLVAHIQAKHFIGNKSIVVRHTRGKGVQQFFKNHNFDSWEPPAGWFLEFTLQRLQWRVHIFNATLA